MTQPGVYIALLFLSQMQVGSLILHTRKQQLNICFNAPLLSRLHHADAPLALQASD